MSYESVGADVRRSRSNTNSKHSCFRIAPLPTFGAVILKSSSLKPLRASGFIDMSGLSVKWFAIFGLFWLEGCDVNDDAAATVALVVRRNEPMDGIRHYRNR